MLREFMVPRRTWHQMCNCEGYWDNNSHTTTCAENYKAYMRMCDAEDRSTIALTLVTAMCTILVVYVIISLVIVTM